MKPNIAIDRREGLEVCYFHSEKVLIHGIRYHDGDSIPLNLLVIKISSESHNDLHFDDWLARSTEPIEPIKKLKSIAVFRFKHQFRGLNWSYSSRIFEINILQPIKVILKTFKPIYRLEGIKSEMILDDIGSHAMISTEG